MGSPKEHEIEVAGSRLGARSAGGVDTSEEQELDRGGRSPPSEEQELDKQGAWRRAGAPTGRGGRAGEVRVGRGERGRANRRGGRGVRRAVAARNGSEKGYWEEDKVESWVKIKNITS